MKVPKVRLIKASSATWELLNDKGNVLVNFTAADALEAKRFAKSWLTSFSIVVELEVPNECQLAEYKDIT
jgi:hypothetical protein